MIDKSKRDSLKVLTGASLVACAPSLAQAAGATQPQSVMENSAANNTIVPLESQAELSISMSLDSDATITLTNHSQKDIQLRHVHPGIVHAGEKSYDINSIFNGQAHTMRAGVSRQFSVQPTVATQAETAFPRYLYREQPQRVVAVTGTDKRGEFINSSRSFYA